MPHAAPRARAVLLVLAALAPLALPLALADSSAIVAQLPGERSWGSAASDGQHVYYFGGSDRNGTWQGGIHRFDPATHAVATMGATLTEARQASRAIWTGTEFLLFGCSDCWPPPLVRYDPATDSATRLATLPHGFHAGIAGVWTGTHVYLFGGDGGGGDKILRYTPASNQFQLMGARLPSARSHAEAFWDGQHAYVVGGIHTIPGVGAEDLDQILRYDPATDTVQVMGARLELPYRFGSLAYGRGVAWLFGMDGWPGNVTTYDPVADALTHLSYRPHTLGMTNPAVWTGSSAALFGVHRTDSTLTVRLDGISLFTPTGAPPAAVARQAGVATCLADGLEMDLDGSLSRDADGDPLTYAWSGPGVAFADPTAPSTRAHVPYGTPQVVLRVSDGVYEDTAALDVQVHHPPPPSLALTRPAPRTAYVLDQPAASTGAQVTLNGQNASIQAVGPLTVVAQAASPCGIARVDFAASYGAQASDASAPYQFVANAPAGAPRFVTVTATAVDNLGQATVASVQFLQQGTG